MTAGERRTDGSDKMLFDRKQLVKLIVPLVCEQVIMGTIGIADMLMVASVGETAISGISLIDSINLLFNSMFAALVTGGTIVCTQYLGKREADMANLAAKYLLGISLLFSLAVAGMCFLFRRMVVYGLYGSAEPEVLRQAMIYFCFSMASYPFLMMLDSCGAIFRSMGNAALPFSVSFFMSIINIVLNAVFIFGLHWGVFGAGFATFLARAVSSAAIFLFLYHHKGAVRIQSFFGSGWHGFMVKNILKLAVPTGLEDSIFHIGKLLVQGIVTSYGTAAIAANAVALTISEFTHMPGFAIGLALITVVGRCVGAGEIQQARYYVKKITGVSFLVTGAAAVLSWIFAGPVVGFYQMNRETWELASEIVRWQAVACLFFWVPAFNISDALRAASDVRFTMAVSMISMWVFRVGCSALFREILDIGVIRVWFAMFLDWMFRAVVFLIRFHGSKWEGRMFL